MNRLFFPTDFSDNSRAALPVAVQLAESLKAPIDFIHTYQLPYRSEALTDNLLQAISERCQLDMSEWLSEFTADTVPVDGHCAYNGLAQELHRRATEHPDSMIVMASQGASGWSEVLLGSNAVSVLHAAQQPVLVVPARSSWPSGQPVKWLYASDLHDERNPKALAWIKSFITQSGGELAIAHVEEGTQGDGPARDFLDFTGTHFPGVEHHLVVAQDVETGIYEAARRAKAHGVIVVARRHHWRRDAFKARTSSALAYHTEYPVLVLRED
ncbi:MAG: universal stress protein [Schleiferiaceae bacterium]